MRNALFFIRLKNNSRLNMAAMACFFLVVFMMGACASEYKKQTPSFANETDQVSAKGESENGETSDAQEIECRTRLKTGTRFKEKVCATKAEWARLDSKNTKKTDEFSSEIDRNTRTYTGPPTDGMGGQSSGAAR